MEAPGSIAFIIFFAERPAGYGMVCMPLTISEATGGACGLDAWSIGHEAKAIKTGKDGSCTLREIDEIRRYILHLAK